MPQIDADFAAQPAHEESHRNPLTVAFVIALLFCAIAIGIFVFMPKQAAETVREVVQAAKSLVQKDPPASPATEEDRARPAIPSPPKLRSHHSLAEGPAVSPNGAEVSAPQPGAAKGILLPNTDLHLGAPRIKVREALGEPDLIVSKLEHGHVVERFVYINRKLNSAISVLLVDGLVTSVNTGTPSVALNQATASPVPGKSE